MRIRDVRVTSIILSSSRSRVLTVINLRHEVAANGENLINCNERAEWAT